jgi:hypothetical protein
MLLVALLTVGLFLPGCEDDGSSAAAEFGAQEGQRPKPKEKRPPPGPPQSGFAEGADEDAVDPPDDD